MAHANPFCAISVSRNGAPGVVGADSQAGWTYRAGCAARARQHHSVGEPGRQPWRAMPHDCRPGRRPYQYCRPWRNEGAWERIHRAMQEQARHQAGQETMPSVMISEEPVGQDHSKRSVWLRRPPIGDGSKRHLLVDVQGIVLKVVVSAASDAGPRVGAASGPRAAAVQTTSASPAP